MVNFKNDELYLLAAAAILISMGGNLGKVTLN